MKLLTFLGASPAYETIYVLPDGREHTANFCGVAIAHFYPGADVYVFVTKKARQTHLTAFQKAIEEYAISLRPVDIPDGANEEELWSIFQDVIDHVEEEEHLIFDITHGFRSLPFLVFLAVAYLRTVKRVTIERVFYGNFEARDTTVTPNRAPVVDMTRFTELLDWMIAADRFIRFGDGSDLAARLEAARPREAGLPQEIYQHGSQLYRAATVLEDLSRALRLIRPEEAMSKSAMLEAKLEQAKASIYQFARPFLPLLEDVISTYARLGLTEKERTEDPARWLQKERHLVKWYLGRKQYAQAVAVAREWIVSWVMYALWRRSHLQTINFLDKSQRQEVERLLGEAIQRRKQGTQLNSDISTLNHAVDLYAKLGGLRNDLMHAAKRRSPQEAKAMEQNLKNYCNELDALQVPLD